MKSKKAMILYYLVIPGFIIGLIAFYAYSVTKMPATTSYVGERELQTIKLSQEAEKSLLYLDNAARLSAKQAVYELAQNAGFSNADINKCGGKLYTNIRWKYNCFPDYPQNFKIRFTEILNKHLEKMKTTFTGTKILLNDHEITIIEGNRLQIIGTAEHPWIFTLSDKGEEQVRYSVYPNFDIELGYDLSEYGQIMADSIKLLESCRFMRDVNTCVAANKPQNFKACGAAQLPSIDEYCVESKTLMNVYDSVLGQYISGPVVYKFALDFSS